MASLAMCVVARVGMSLVDSLPGASLFLASLLCPTPQK